MPSKRCKYCGKSRGHTDDCERSDGRINEPTFGQRLSEGMEQLDDNYGDDWTEDELRDPHTKRWMDKD